MGSQRVGHDLVTEQQQCSVTNHNGNEYGKMENVNDEEHTDTYIQLNHFANKGLYSQSYGFSSSHIWM